MTYIQKMENRWFKHDIPGKSRLKKRYSRNVSWIIAQVVGGVILQILAQDVVIVQDGK